MAAAKKTRTSALKPVQLPVAEQELPDIPAAPISFETESNSPFVDGYSIEREEQALAEFMAGPMDESDPLYDRYIELIDRKDRLDDMQKRFQERRGAEPVVERSEARGLDDLGTLVDEDVDQMTIHTKEAYRMFMGRAREPKTGVNAIVGGKRVASALRGLWLLTGNDNPYADWALLRHEQTIHQIQRRLEREIKDCEQAIDSLRRKGLSFSVLQSAEPKVLNLGYRSPYGYAISHLIVDFDYFVRLQKTLARKNLRSDDDMRTRIAEITRYVRRVFNETTRFDRWLTREEVAALSRSDFIPGAEGDAAKRVEFASTVFGMVPSEVFTTKLQPRHSRRRLKITEAERELLRTVGERLEQAEHELEQDVAAAEAAVHQESDAGLV